MKSEDIKLFIEEGRSYLFGDGQTEVVGKVLKISESAVIVQKQNGMKKIISFDNIHTIDEDISIGEIQESKEAEKGNSVKNSVNDEVLKLSSNSVLDITAFSGDGSEVELSPYLLSLIERIDLKKYSKQSLIEERLITTGKFSGTSEEAENSIKKLKQYLKDYDDYGKKKEMSGDLYLAMARIAYDTSKRCDIPKDYIMTLLGAALVELGDQKIIDPCKNDSARSYYIEALKILPSQEDKNHIKAANMLVYSFFKVPSDLENDIKNRQVSERENFSKYYDNLAGFQNNIREFIITTFMLYNDGSRATKVVGMIKESICRNQPLLDAVKIDLACIQNKTPEEMDTDFSDAWKDAYDIYTEQMIKLNDSIGLCASEITLEEQLKNHIDQIKEIKSKKILFGDDDDKIGKFIEKITKLIEIRKCETVNEKINVYRDLNSGPSEEYSTEWSYSAMKEPNEKILEEIKNRVEELCNKSKPQLEISVLNSEAMMSDGSVKIEINVKNREHCQTADAIDIDVSCLDNEIKTEEVETFSSVESGEQDTYVMKFHLTENTIKQEKFKIAVKVKYKYYMNFMTSVDSEESAEFVIGLISEKFKQIDNRYHKIVNGTGLKGYPEMFKGRTELINKLCASMDLGNGKMNTNRGIVLWGQRRVGKNSVKDHFKEQLKMKYPKAYIHIDIKSIGRAQGSFKNLLLLIISSTEKEIKRHHKELFEKYMDAGLCDLSKQIKTDDNYVVSFGEYMQELMDVIHDNSEPYTNIPLYYIDEFTYAYAWIMEGKVDGKEFMQFWKSFISDYGICAVLLAQDNMPVWKAEYPNEFNCMDFDNMISYLDRSGTEELVCEPCPINGKSRFNGESVEYIYNLTRGSAYLIDILCDQIIEYLNEIKETDYVTKYTVENVLLSWIEGDKDFFEETIFEAQYQDTSKVGEAAKNVEKANKELLSEISVETKDKEFADKATLEFFADNEPDFANEIYERLVKRKILTEDGNKCKLYMPLLKFMFLKKKGLMDKEALENVD